MNGGERIEDYDRACLQSWIACGFHILAVNGADEIPLLSERYPEVEFIPLTRTARSVFGRNTPFIADMLSVLAGRSEPVLGIINCDLLFEPDSFWRELPRVIATQTLIMGHRYDVFTLEGGVMTPYYAGYDYFFFDRAAAMALAQTPRPFSMGLPWWDYWLPLSLRLRGYQIQCLKTPVVLHLQHEQRIGARTVIARTLAREFARAMLHDSRVANLRSQDWHDLVELCRMLDQADNAQVEAGAFDKQIIAMCPHAVTLITGNLIEMRKGSKVQHPAASAGWFDNFDRRAEAGTALMRGLGDEKKGNLTRATWQFERAAEMAPHDGGVLSECCYFFYRQGKMERAAALLARASELAPNSPQLLKCLGYALSSLNRNDEAAECFERAIEADPFDGRIYHKLAVLLWPQNRHAEVVRRLEQRLAQTSDFPEGVEWLERIRDTLSGFGHDMTSLKAD
jgi:tetratricopeptide (TPR) repeat protein